MSTFEAIKRTPEAERGSDLSSLVASAAAVKAVHNLARASVEIKLWR
jgi:hypothetical protein